MNYQGRPEPLTTQIADGSAVGIDFGTTNSVIAIASPNGHVEVLNWPTPSGPSDTCPTALMFWRESGKVQKAAGFDAVARAISAETEQRFIQSIKTHLASPVFSEARLYGERFFPEQLIAIFLDHLLSKLALETTAEVPVAVGRPVTFAGERPDEALAVSRLEAALAISGLPKATLAFEPLGAAYWYARALSRDETVLVADFGGGTSDFSVLRFHRDRHAIATEALAHTGVGVAGDTFDYRLIDHVVAPRLGKNTFYRSFEKRLPMPAYFYAAFSQWHQLSWLKSGSVLSELKKLGAVSEKPHMIDDLVTLIEMDLGFALHRAVGATKTALSSTEEALFKFDYDGIRIEAGVKRSEFETWIASDLDKISGAVEAALAKSGQTADDIDAVFMTGGTSYVPAVRSLFLKRFGKDKIRVGDAFHSVAAGLALYALDETRKR
jgi:hypothetical chaperone protein